MDEPELVVEGHRVVALGPRTWDAFAEVSRRRRRPASPVRHSRS